MKLSPPNLILLASCFGIAFEFRKMLNNVGPMSSIEHADTAMKRKDWLKSDSRKQMEEVAIKQGWVQYVDAATKKRFWYCPFTEESFFELVFVGTESNIRLSRWCSPSDSKGAQIQKNIDHGYVPPPPSHVLSIPRTLSSQQDEEIVNEADHNTEVDFSEIITIQNDQYEPNEAKGSLLGKQKPVKGRHTKGRKTKKIPSRLMKMAEQERTNKNFKKNHEEDQGEEEEEEEEESREGIVLDNITSVEETEAARRRLAPRRRRSFPRNASRPISQRPNKNSTNTSTSLSTSLSSGVKSSEMPSESSKKRYPFFMHLHKAAGTTLCELAVINKIRAAGMKGDNKLGFNCNILGDDPGHLGLGVRNQDSTYGQAEGAFSCESRYDMLQKRGLGFTAIERWIYPTEICPQSFVYMTCFRDPISRIKSSVKFHKKQTEEIVMGWATNHAFFPHAPVSTGSASVDNFYVRSFAGKSTFLKKLGTVTHDEMLMAQHILSQFEVVLILENFSRDLLQLKAKLGWNINGLGRAKSSAGKKCEFTAKETAKLTSLNSLDYELYAYAKTMAEGLSKQAAAHIVKKN